MGTSNAPLQYLYQRWNFKEKIHCGNQELVYWAQGLWGWMVLLIFLSRNENNEVGLYELLRYKWAERKRQSRSLKILFIVLETAFCEDKKCSSAWSLEHGVGNSHPPSDANHHVRIHSFHREHHNPPESSLMNYTRHPENVEEVVDKIYAFSYV